MHRYAVVTAFGCQCEKRLVLSWCGQGGKCAKRAKQGNEGNGRRRRSFWKDKARWDRNFKSGRMHQITKYKLSVLKLKKAHIPILTPIAHFYRQHVTCSPSCRQSKWVAKFRFVNAIPQLWSELSVNSQEPPKGSGMNMHSVICYSRRGIRKNPIANSFLRLFISIVCERRSIQTLSSMHRSQIVPFSAPSTVNPTFEERMNKGN